MTSKYDTYWQNHLDAILALFDQARAAGASSPLQLTDLDALGARGSWYGKLEFVAGQSVYNSGAHLAALGVMLTPRLPEWASEGAWTVTMSEELQLTVEKTEPQQTNWFENAYRNAKQTETITRAGVYLGRLKQETAFSGWCQTPSGKRVYVLFTAQRDRWLAPRRARLEDAATAGGEVVISLTDEISGRFDLWIIPAADLMAAIQRAAFAPSLDRGNAYNFNLQTNEAADVIRQLNWNIRSYRRESVKTELTRARFWPEGGPFPTRTLAKPFSDLFADWEEAEWAFDLLAEAAQRLGVTGPDDPLASWTLRRTAGQYHLHFCYAKWLVLGLAGANGDSTLKLALFRDRLELPTTRVEGFNKEKDETPVSLHYLAARAWRQLRDSQQEVYGETLDYIKQLFAGWQASPYHKYTDAPLALAVFDTNARRRLLGNGMEAPTQRFWKIAPGDDAWQWNECRDDGFIAIGWDELGDLSNLDRASFEARRAGIQQKHPDWTNEAMEQAWKFAQIQEGDQIVANRGTTKVLGIGTVTGPYYFMPGVRHGHRLPVQWDDTVMREVNEGGWRRTLVELAEAKFSAVASATPSASVDDELVAHAESAFSPRAFQLLQGIHEQPTKAYYQAHKGEFKTEIEEPFQHPMARVAEQLPVQVREAMETQQGIFGRFLKNDWGKGGAWDFYWGAFYPKGGKRAQDAQLFASILPGFYHFGFSFGAYASEQRQRFQQNCKTHAAALVNLLSETLADTRFVFGRSEGITITEKGEVSSQEGCTWQEFLADPERASCRVSVVFPRATVLRTPAKDLIADMAQTFERLFPLVLLAVEDDPLPAIEDYLEPLPTEQPHPAYTLTQCAAETGFSEEELAGWVRAIERKGQVILYGPPGTGKTFIAERLARHLIGGGDGVYDLVQFHPAYAYEDFIQGIRPKTTAGGGLSYPTEPGRFLEFCAKAAGRQGRCVLIIDEINRANLARVFGELMYLLEYRDREMPLAGGGRLRIPTNVRLIGTMNTADRSIALVDHALRRRFAFLALYPRFDVLRDFHQRQNTGYPVEKLIKVLEGLNTAIDDRHYHVGITYFLREALAAEIADIWRMEIEPYLDEYFFDQPDKANAFRWEQVHAELQTSPTAQGAS